MKAAAQGTLRDAQSRAAQTVAAAQSTLSDLEERRQSTVAEIELAQAAVRSATGELAGHGGDEPLATFDAATRKLAGLRQRLAALDDEALPAATDRLEAAEFAMADAARRIQYAEAQDLADKVAELLQAEYPRLAEAYRTLLKQVSEATLAVRAANADLPASAPPLQEPEAQVRDRPATVRQVFREEEVVLWVYAHTGQPLSDESARKVRAKGGGKGVLLPPDNQAPRQRPAHEVLLQRFRRIEFRPAQSRRTGARLSHMGFPALRCGEPPLWRSIERAGPAEVLTALATTGPVEREAAVQIELLPVMPLGQGTADGQAD